MSYKISEEGNVATVHLDGEIDMDVTEKAMGEQLTCTDRYVTEKIDEATQKMNAGQFMNPYDKSKDAIEDKAQFASTDCNTDNQGFTRITHTKTATANNVFITSCAGDTADDFVKDTIAVE